MACVFEMVLDVPHGSLRAWPVSPEFRHHSQIAHTPDAKLVSALDALSCLTRTSHSAEERCMVVSRHTAVSPGVMLRETLYDAALDGDALPESALAGAPASVRHALKSADNLTTSVTVARERHVWRWQSADNIVVDILFERIVAQPGSTASPQRELRLSVPHMQDAVRGALDALFEAARQLVVVLPAFPVLGTAVDHPCDDGNTRDTLFVPARATPIDLSGVSTPQAALIAITSSLAQHWFGNDAGVREAISAEFVHQLRVAQRRLKTVMRIFPHWADDAWTTRIAPEMKWLGGILSEARDWDVFVDSTLPALAGADSDGERWAGTREHANVRRLAARERVQAAVASTRYAHLALAWLEWLSVLHWREPPAKAKNRTLHAYAKKRMRKYYDRLVSASKLTTLDDKARHKERIQAKYLRYTLEFFESIVSRKTRGECAKTVARLQDVLGDGNDVAVALGFLKVLEVEPYQAGFAQGWCEATKRYSAQEGERLLRSLREPKISRRGGG
jgi:CHAD domain-containing protein